MGIPDNELDQITNQYLEESEDNFEIELAEYCGDHWTIDTKEMAMKIDYVLSKLEEKIALDEAIAIVQKAPLQAKIDKLNEGIAKLDEWLERSTKGYRANIEDLKQHMHLYHMRLIEAEEIENEKRVAADKKPLKISKSIKLTYRDLTSKVQQPEIKKDDELLAAWVEEKQSTPVSVYEIAKLIEGKDEYDQLSVKEIYDFLKSYQSEYVKRDPQLAWGELKKTLEQKEVDVISIIDDHEIVVGKRLAYFNEYGEEVPHIELTKRGVVYGWNILK
jgi:hypothetical protein